MAAISDLIAKTEDEVLRNKIDAELKRLLCHSGVRILCDRHRLS